MKRDKDQVTYRVELIDAIGPDPGNDNVDVQVEFSDGRKYVATFFTLDNIRFLMEKNRVASEDGNGIYFWASDMIIVERIDPDLIQKAVADMIETEFFEQAFDGPFFIDSEGCVV